MRFDFSTAGRILFGRGTLSEAGSAASQLGGKALVVTGSDGSRACSLLDILSHNGVGYVTFQVGSEPTLDTARRGSQEARGSGCDMVISMGGGSAMDLGKTVAMLLTNRGDPQDYLEVIGKGRTIALPSAPFVAIPTTAGTGSEVTCNAVLASTKNGIKASLRSHHMIPNLALVDPDLMVGLPADVTASTGMDALTQLFEPFVSRQSNPMTDAVCRGGMRRVARSLERAFTHGNDLAAREDMAMASLWGGVALANSGLGAVHGFAAAIGGSYRVPHGALCARLLPMVMKLNIAALRKRMPGSDALDRFDEAATILTGSPDAEAGDCVDWALNLCKKLGIPGLSYYGVLEKDFSGLVQLASRSSSMKGNPIPLTSEELTEVLAGSL